MSESELTWQEKLATFRGMVPMLCVGMRRPYDWYVSINVERKEGGCLSSGLVSNAKTPQEAVEQFWAWATDQRFYIVTHAYTNDRKAFAWGGNRWLQISETAYSVTDEEIGHEPRSS